MAQRNVTELRSGAYFQESGQLFQVLTYEHIKMGRGSGTIKVKVRNLKTGATTEKSFITGARVEEAVIEKQKAQYLYRDGDPPAGGYYFMDPVSFEQFSMQSQVLGDNAKYLQEGMEVSLVVFEEEAIGIELPNNIVYTIAQTGPGEKGNTVSNVYKEATVDNGLVVKVPMFINNGDKVRVDTRTGQYVERVK